MGTLIIPDEVKSFIYKLEPGSNEQAIALKKLERFLKKHRLTLRDIIAFTDDLDKKTKEAATATSQATTAVRQLKETEHNLETATNEFASRQKKMFKLLEEKKQKIESLEKGLHSAPTSRRSSKKIKKLKQKNEELKLINAELLSINAGLGKSRKTTKRKIVAVTFVLAATFFTGGFVFTEGFSAPSNTGNVSGSYGIKNSGRAQAENGETYYVRYAPATVWEDVVCGKGKWKIASLKFQEKVQVKHIIVDVEKEWAKVRIPNGKKGYVLMKQLSPLTPS